ncbi:MAG: Fur family zinc uptake transcriptional regulator [Cognaticolwellia sp.]|jgi:Fur family zinc uptake transcriptional regulator|tara:strand:- start:159 stop:632 length:474 start_codon:yes stop_codon:yes gene_type:complete
MGKLTLIEKLLLNAEAKCKAVGGRFTDKRRDILEDLIRAKHPLSAYDLVELYNQNSDQKIQPMSVYRILDFFIEMQLVHKLPTLNKYIVCSHLACKHAHKDQYFVVCKSCGDAQEIGMNPTLTKELNESVSSVGFQLIDAQFELLGICNDCASKVGN